MAASVLIIDAEEAFANQLSDALRAVGVESNLTADGKAGLDLARINIPAAIILCVELPGVSGYMICNKLKKDEILKSVPVVLTSSEADEHTFANHRKLRTRAEEYLKKPFPPALLVELLEGHLGLFAGQASGPEEVEIDDEIPVDLAPPETMSDDEAFSAEEAASMYAGGDPSLGGATLDVAQSGMRSSFDESPFANALAASAGSALPNVDEDSEALTTVGVLDPGADTAELQAELLSIKTEMESLRRAKESAERARDEAYANQLAAEAQAEAMSHRPSVAPAPSGSREVLELKRQRNALEKDLLTVREDLNTKERELITWRDKEAELEGRVVELEESLDEALRGKSAAEGVAAGAKARAEEMERSLEAQNQDLRERLSASTAHEAELEDAVGSLQVDLREAQAALGSAERQAKERDDDAQRLSRQLAALDESYSRKVKEIDRLGNELSAAGAEAQSLRETIHQHEEEVAGLQARVGDLEQDLSTAYHELEQLRGQLSDALSESAAASDSLERAEEIRNKALKAMDIAQAFLREAGYSESKIQRVAGDEYEAPDAEGFDIDGPGEAQA